MKAFKLIVAVFILITFQPHETKAQCPTPEPLDKAATIGNWEGAYSLAGDFIKFGLQLKEENGILMAFIDIPGAEQKYMKYDCRICKSQELHFSNIQDESGMEFVGLVKKNNTMTGKLRFWEGDKIKAEEVFTLKKTGITSSLN